MSKSNKENVGYLRWKIKKRKPWKCGPRCQVHLSILRSFILSFSLVDDRIELFELNMQELKWENWNGHFQCNKSFHLFLSHSPSFEYWLVNRPHAVIFYVTNTWDGLIISRFHYSICFWVIFMWKRCVNRLKSEQKLLNFDLIFTQLSSYFNVWSVLINIFHNSFSRSKTFSFALHNLKSHFVENVINIFFSILYRHRANDEAQQAQTPINTFVHDFCSLYLETIYVRFGSFLNHFSPEHKTTQTFSAHVAKI